MKWEYIVQVLPEMSPQDSLLNSLGEEEWELVSIVVFEDQRIAYLKRPFNRTEALRRELVRSYLATR